MIQTNLVSVEELNTGKRPAIMCLIVDHVCIRLQCIYIPQHTNRRSTTIKMKSFYITTHICEYFILYYFRIFAKIVQIFYLQLNT